MKKMQKKGLVTLLAGILLASMLGFSGIANAATDNSGSSFAQNNDQPESVQVLEPIIDVDKTVGVGRKAFFDASRTVNSYPNTRVNYDWDFGDGARAIGVDVTHTYSQAGEYRVRLTADNGKVEKTTETIVSAFEDVIIIITDNETTEDQINNLARQAAKQGMVLVEVVDRSSDPDFIVTETLTQELIARTQEIEKADIIIDWTTGNLGLTVLSKFSQEVKDLKELDFPNKAVISVVSGSFATVNRTAQSTYNTLRPEIIGLIRSEALDAVIDAGESGRVVDNLRATGSEIQLIGVFSERFTELGPLNFLTFIINYMVNRGVPLNSIFLILTLPIIATIIAFARQVIGVKTFGIFTPSILTLAFLATGIKFGLVVFLIVLLVGTLSRLLLKRLRLFFLPRVAIVVSLVSLTILAIMGVGSLLDLTGLITLAVFPVLIMAILIEPIVSIQIERGSLAAIILTIETLALSVAAYFVVTWEPFRLVFLNYPELILLTFVVNILLGKWTGLRLTEYFRFREVRRFIKAGKSIEE